MATATRVLHAGRVDARFPPGPVRDRLARPAAEITLREAVEAVEDAAAEWIADAPAVRRSVSRAEPDSGIYSI